MNHPATQARQQLGNTARQEISSTAVEALSRAFREPQLAGYIYWEGKGEGTLAHHISIRKGRVTGKPPAIQTPRLTSSTRSLKWV